MEEGIGTNYRSIWTLVWPQALTLVATLMMSLVDTWAASKINAETLASFGILNQTVLFLSIIGQGVVAATLSLVGQARGAKKYVRSKKLAITMFGLSIFSGIIVISIAYFFTEHFLVFFKTPSYMFDAVSLWFLVYLISIPFQYAFLTTNAILRSIKKVKIILFVAILSAVLNTYFTIGLAFGSLGMPDIGAVGIPIATLTTLAIVVCINCIILYKEDILKAVYIPSVQWLKGIEKSIRKVALPIMGMQLLWQTGYILVFALMAHLPEGGRIGISGFSVGLRIESILFVPGMAMQFTASILISHLIGAKEYVSARAVGTKLMLLGVIIISLFILPMWFYMDSIVALFSPDPLVQHNVKLYLKYNLMSIPFVMITITGSGIFVGSGATIYSFIAFACSMWLVRLPVAYILGYIYNFNSEGVYISMLVSAIVQAGLITYYYIGSNWEGTKKVVV